MGPSISTYLNISQHISTLVMGSTLCCCQGAFRLAHQLELLVQICDEAIVLDGIHHTNLPQKKAPWSPSWHQLWLKMLVYPWKKRSQGNFMWNKTWWTMFFFFCFFWCTWEYPTFRQIQIKLHHVQMVTSRSLAFISLVCFPKVACLAYSWQDSPTPFGSICCKWACERIV